MSDKIKEILDTYCAADEGVVNSWNRDFGWGRQPHIEDHVQFLRVRLNNTMKALRMIAEVLIQERAEKGANNG